jgi:hypothetical protein
VILLICLLIFAFELYDFTATDNMPDNRNMSEIRRHSERLTNGDDGVVCSIPDVPITEQRKPFVNSESSKLQHTGMCSLMRYLTAALLT